MPKVLGEQERAKVEISEDKKLKMLLDAIHYRWYLTGKSDKIKHCWRDVEN